MLFLLAIACLASALQDESEWVKLPGTTPSNMTGNFAAEPPQLKWACAFGTARLYAYERNIQWCIGGGTGSAFQIRQNEQTVRQIRVWTGGANGAIRAILLSYFNGRQFSAGSLPASGATATFTFQVGEYLVDSIVLGGNGIGTRLGHISFTTSNNNRMSVGQLNTPYISQADNGFFTGVFGAQGTDIDHMSMAVMKRVRSSRLQSLNYPTLSSQTAGLTPQIYRTSFCNDGNLVQSQTATFEQTVGTSRTWSVTASMMIGSSVTVSGGFPGIVNVSGTFSWQRTVSGTYSSTTNTARKQTMSFPINVEPRSRITATFTWWDSQINVPYTARLVHTFSDGRTYGFPVNDTYDGAYITESHSSTRTTYLSGGQNC